MRLPSPGPVGRHAALAMAACFLLMAISRGTTETFAVFLLPLSLEFDADRASVAAIYGVFMLCFGLGSALAGRLFDKVGPGGTYLFGLGCLGISLLASAWLDGLWQFYVSLGVFAGFGAAATSQVPHAALLSRWYRGNLTTAIALVSAAAGLGVLLLSPLTQFLIDTIGWRDTYQWLGLGVLAMILVIGFLPWRAIARGRPEPEPVAGEGWRQREPDEFVTFRQALHMRAFWALSVVQFLTAVSMFAINPQIVAFLIETGFDPLVSASAFGLAGVAGTFGLVVFGLLADRVGRMFAITLSYSMTLAGFVLLWGVSLHPVVWLVWVFAFVYGPTFGSRGPIVNGMVTRIFGRGPDLGTIIGVVNLGMGLGAAVGAAMGGVLHDLTGDYDAVLAFGFVFAALPLAIFWMVPELRRT